MSRRHNPTPTPPGYADVPAVAVVCGGTGTHPRAHLFDLLDGRTIGQGDTVLWRGESPQTAYAGPIPVYRFTCRRCRRDVPLRLPTLLAEIDATREAHPERARPVVDIAALRTGVH